jgi:hypothetical protein
MHLRVGFLLVAGGLVAALAASGSGVAKDVRIGPVALTLPPPEGYCELIAEQPSDDSWVKGLSALLGRMQIELLAVSAECGRLAAWRANGQPLGVTATYQMPIAAKDSTFRREQLIKDACAFARAEGDKLLAQAAPDVAKRLEAAIQRTVKFNAPTSLGVLAESADACYSGIVTKVRIGDGTEAVRMDISATTVVKGKGVIYHFEAAYENAATVTTTLARHRRNVSALLAANGG